MLGDTRDSSAVEPLIWALRDGFAEVRSSAAIALGKIKDLRAVDSLVTALKDNQYQVSGAAGDALISIGPPAAPSLIAAMKSDDSEARAYAAQLLVTISAAQLFPRNREEGGDVGFRATSNAVKVPTDEKIRTEYSKACALNTESAYRSFLALFDADPAPSSTLYWAARENVEKLIISKINKAGIGRRFHLDLLQPQKNSKTGNTTFEDPDSLGNAANAYVGRFGGLFEGSHGSISVAMRSLYPGDSKPEFIASLNGLEPRAPMGNKSVIRFIGVVVLGTDAVFGDNKEPLSFVLLEPYGAVYLDGRGVVVTGSGKTVPLPISPISESDKRGK
jgi:hypothetical protein